MKPWSGIPGYALLISCPSHSSPHPFTLIRISAGKRSGLKIYSRYCSFAAPQNRVELEAFIAVSVTLQNDLEKLLSDFCCIGAKNKMVNIYYHQGCRRNNFFFENKSFFLYVLFPIVKDQMKIHKNLLDIQRTLVGKEVLIFHVSQVLTKAKCSLSVRTENIKLAVLAGM